MSSHLSDPRPRPALQATTALPRSLSLSPQIRMGVLATLAACSLALLASYSLIGIACDFRYAYFLVPVALTGAFSVWLPATRTGVSPR